MSNHPLESLLSTFCSRFVLRPYRHRFLHDALKRPEGLSTKLAGPTTWLRADRDDDAFFPDVEDTHCIVFSCGVWDGQTSWPWTEHASTEQVRRDLVGTQVLLVIGADATWFYAESEGEPPHRVVGTWPNRAR